MPSGGSALPPARPAIALVSYATPPVIGGVERVLARHAVLMADAGHQVRVIAGRGGALDPRVRFVEIPLVNSRHPTIERLQRALDEGRVPAEFSEVATAIVAQLAPALAGIDIVIAHNVCSLNLNLALTAALRELMDRPAPPRLILWHHDLAWASLLHRPTLHPGTPWDLLRTAWPGAVQVVVSEGRRAELAALMGIRPETITVVPNGVDLAKMWKLEPRTIELIARTDLLGAAPLLLIPRGSRRARTSSSPSGWWPRCAPPAGRPDSSSAGQPTRTVRRAAPTWSSSSRSAMSSHSTSPPGSCRRTFTGRRPTR